MQKYKGENDINSIVVYGQEANSLKDEDKVSCWFYNLIYKFHLLEVEGRNAPFLFVVLSWCH